MKRLVTLTSGVAAGVLAALGCLYLLTLAWPGLLRPGEPIATAPPEAAFTSRPPATPAPSATPNAARMETVSPLLRVVVTPTPEPLDATAMPLTRLALQAEFEALGFAFQRSDLGDGREHWVAASPDRLALADIIGGEAVEAASVTVFGPIGQDAEGGPQRVVYMLTLLNAALPGWAKGAEWFAAELVNMAHAPGDFAVSTARAGLRVTLAQDAGQGAITLSVAHE
ncbi:MAG: hypothetical protein IT318_12435 [Anaerolineales bacterium]|nr:hypothetical protein [Anaerolineales bacterium]